MKISGKISARQAVILLILLTYSPTMGLLTSYTVMKANQAAWLSPLVALAIDVMLVLLMSVFYKKGKMQGSSYLTILEAVFGKVIGRLLIVLYFLYITLLVSFYVRYYAEKLVNEIYSRIDINMFIGIMLLLVALGLKYGLTVVSRMGEILFPFLLATFILFTILILPDADFSALLPVSPTDILPVTSAGLTVASIFAYFIFILMISDKVNKPENLKKAGLQAAIFLFTAITIAIMTCLVTLNYSIVKMVFIPYLSAIKNIELFNIIGRVEPIAVSLFLISDFMLIFVFCYTALRCLEHIFCLKRICSFNNIYLLLIFILSLSITSNIPQLQFIGNNLVLPLSYVFILAMPVLVFIIGKLRKII